MNVSDAGRDVCLTNANANGDVGRIMRVSSSRYCDDPSRREVLVLNNGNGRYEYWTLDQCSLAEQETKP